MERMEGREARHANPHTHASAVALRRTPRAHALQASTRQGTGTSSHASCLCESRISPSARQGTGTSSPAPAPRSPSTTPSRRAPSASPLRVPPPRPLTPSCNHIPGPHALEPPLALVAPKPRPRVGRTPTGVPVRLGPARRARERGGAHAVWLRPHGEWEREGKSGEGEGEKEE